MSRFSTGLEGRIDTSQIIRFSEVLVNLLGIPFGANPIGVGSRFSCDSLRRTHENRSRVEFFYSCSKRTPKGCLSCTHGLCVCNISIPAACHALKLPFVPHRKHKPAALKNTFRPWYSYPGLQISHDRWDERCLSLGRTRTYRSYYWYTSCKRDGTRIF